MPVNVRQLWLTMTAAALPGVARASDLALPDVFAGAAPPQKLIIVALLAAATAAALIAAIKLSSKSIAGGSAFLSGLRWGGPLTGVLGGAYSTLKMSAGIATVTAPLTLKMLAPALAEIATLIALGFSVGVLAVAFNWAIEARIDHEVLRS